MPGGKTLLPAAVASADEIKMVIGKPADLDRLQRILDHYPIKPDCQVCLQPLSGSRKATDLCLDAALRLGYRLSVQTHKAIGVR
jgi:7-carboxy-7-deazaguanine synthase